ncbi:hypothetical protein WA026_012787 [Henosepilachna vigintioctopunctata]|uniref:Integrase catalytic domain-containing protein n=1 Tax=Henosepilachna vigintioctopunctata TaxID=420089 RepID=A0AAW1U1R1_9CUCU
MNRNRVQYPNGLQIQERHIVVNNEEVLMNKTRFTKPREIQLVQKGKFMEATCVDYVSKVSSLFCDRIVGLKCCNGGEYRLSLLLEFCEEKGIRISHTPQMNGVAEMMNQTLMDKENLSLSRDSRRDNLTEINTVKSYAAAVGSKSDTSVLLVRSTNQNTDIKSKINPSKVNAKIVGTRLIKDGLLIQCEDDESRDNLRNSILRDFKQSFNVSLPRKRILVL